MEGFIPEEIIDRVRSSTDIVELVSGYVSLKKRGANYLGLCPFHQEKTPSFTVSPSKQIFHCFGCGAGGDAVGFVIRQENLTFPEAVRRLAEKAGIDIPEAGPSSAKKKGEYEAVLRANEEAAAFFERCLLDSKEGAAARRYLEGRGFSPEQAREFSIGYSPPGWDGLLGRLEKKGIGAAAAEKAGLAIPRQKGEGHYDRFRDRLMFTIRDARGRVVGFGGRIMGEGEPKYLNSPETAVFKKGETLYMLDAAAEHIRKAGFSIITEGYFDATACHRAGVKNAVATLGTALTGGHLRLLRRFSKNVLLVFDSDEAGIKAAERSLDVFLGTDMTAKVALLPTGDDPDSLLRREGSGKLRERLGMSEKLVEFVIKRRAAGADSIEKKVAASGELVGMLARMENSVERSYYLKKSAEELGVEEQALAEELNKRLGRSTAVYRGAPRNAATGLEKIEEQLLSIMLRFNGVTLEVREMLKPEDFTLPKHQALARRIFALVDEGVEVSHHRLLDRLESEEEKGLVVSLSIKEEVEDAAGYATGAIQRLSENTKKRRRQDIQALIREAERNKDDKMLLKLSRELNELTAKKKAR